MIRLDHVSFHYSNGPQVLKSISFSLEKGGSVGLVGANGAGKSTLLKLLVGLVSGFEGEVKVAGLSMDKKNLAGIRAKVGYVFQDSDSQLFNNTVYDEIAFGPRNYGLSEEEVKKRADEAMEKTGTAYLKDKPVYQMSGGEKRLVSIATILSMEPELILMDEPEAALDPRNRRRLIGLLKGLQPAKLIASHDLDMIMDTCERTILMHQGAIVADGPTDKILRDKELLEAHDMELPLRLQNLE